MSDSPNPDDADWVTSMFDLQADLLKRAVNEANRLRRRVRELETLINSGNAAEMSALQDRVTQLELLLKEARDAG